MGQKSNIYGCSNDYVLCTYVVIDNCKPYNFITFFMLLVQHWQEGYVVTKNTCHIPDKIN